MPRKLKDWITGYTKYSQFSESPDSFHFWTAVATLAGALRRRVWIDQVYFQWSPNFYLVFVAPPGVAGKTTTMNIGMSMLKKIPDVKFGPDAITWQALVASLADAAREEINPATGEHIQMSCLTIAAGEFGTLLNPQDREMVDVLTSLWDGQVGAFEKVTKTQGSERVINPWVNIVSATTPAWVAGFFPEHLIGGGFASRCLFVFEHQKRKQIAYPRKQVHDMRSLQSLHRELIEDLEHISHLIGEYELTPDAIEFGEKWYEDHWNDPHADLDSERFSGYVARKQTHIHKLAMVLSASHSDELVIEAEDLKRADRLVTALEADMPKVYGLIGRSSSARASEVIANLIHRKHEIDRTDIYLALHGHFSSHEIEMGIKGTLAAGMAVQRVEGGRLMLMATSRGSPKVF